jgi:hypothetical protein
MLVGCSFMPPTHSSCTGNISRWISFSTGQMSTILVSTVLYQCGKGREGKQCAKLSNKQQNKTPRTAEKGSPALLDMVRSYILCTTAQTGLAQGPHGQRKALERLQQKRSQTCRSCGWRPRCASAPCQPERRPGGPSGAAGCGRGSELL